MISCTWIPSQPLKAVQVLIKMWGKTLNRVWIGNLEILKVYQKPIYNTPIQFIENCWTEIVMDLLTELRNSWRRRWRKPKKPGGKFPLWRKCFKDLPIKKVKIIWGKPILLLIGNIGLNLKRFTRIIRLRRKNYEFL